MKPLYRLLVASVVIASSARGQSTANPFETPIRANDDVIRVGTGTSLNFPTLTASPRA
ncbi:MAG: hypothetical protein ACT4OZ_17145 [Gemmatimonadota bacterium]